HNRRLLRWAAHQSRRQNVRSSDLHARPRIMRTVNPGEEVPMRASLRYAILALLAAASLPSTIGCSRGDAAGAAILELPLLITASDGTIFRLSNATFELTAPDGTIQTIDGNVDQPSVTATLTPATYSVRLRPGWVLQRSTDGGVTFADVSAILGSQNPQVVD